MNLSTIGSAFPFGLSAETKEFYHPKRGNQEKSKETPLFPSPQGFH